MYRIIILVLFLVCGKTIFAQKAILDSCVNLNYRNEKLIHVIEDISKQTSVYFAYNPQILPAEKKINTKQKQITLENALNHIFENTEISYKLVDKQIILFKKGDIDPKPKQMIADSCSYFEISGRITDAQTHSALAFANIGIIGTSIGTISNAAGEFVFKFKEINPTLKLVISFLGYETFSLFISDINTSYLNVALQPLSINLKEIKVTPKEGLEIVKKAIAKIPNNYDNKSCKLTGFIRETTKQNDNYISISEAVVEINKSAYSEYFKTDQAKVFKGRRSTNVKKMEAISYKVQGGIYNSLQLDIVKYLPSFLSTDYFEYYKYEVAGIVPLQQRHAYLIKFDQVDNLNTSLYKGELYIDTETLTIVLATFALSPKGIDFAGAMLVKKSPLGFKVKPMYAGYTVNYKEMDGKWFLNNIRAEILIKAKAKKNLFTSLFTTEMEMVITEKDTLPHERFKNSEIAKQYDVLEEHVGEYDENFWGKYNLIKPDESIIDAIHKIGLLK